MKELYDSHIIFQPDSLSFLKRTSDEMKNQDWLR